MTREEASAAFDAETLNLEIEAFRHAGVARSLMVARDRLTARGGQLWERHRLERQIGEELTAALDCWEQARAGVLESESGSFTRMWSPHKRGR